MGMAGSLDGIRRIIADKIGLTPVHFFSHGSTMMLGEISESADYWRRTGEEALAHNIKGVIIMGAHWDCLGDKIEVATNPNPDKSPVAYVHPDKYINYKLNPDLETAQRCIDMLTKEGFNASGNPTFDWIHDVYLILIHMFPNGCPPTTIISMNARYDPHYHMKVGATLRPLRYDNYLLIGTGGAVHNLYRNCWAPMLRFRDNFAMETPPEEWALEFRQAVEDVITKTSGPALRRAMTRLMKHPQYRDAHATDDHFMAAMFVAGAMGDFEDTGSPAVMGAESWELTNMCNSQFTLGSWSKDISV
ncbi:DODA-type extradiol aromatic ring-opening family dioxygenase [Aspergillus fischeri NRRL 181]|uniref:Aromatic ring-opening dioxygenase, catalytic LigB subunit, putative n=1 Tax=Neosartorya fischeri (strain ATCC 1020 / DSM 3700 / CBS 544.65 / FGSC A1164 / JCM 1740 / NRRL 181 / WB 181) TaxID=331117 RepID=A1D8U0_NEOFI|nr:aromatic ring-opening dioxygenase, catalytic LigB subunit, putative [Aspergillus fischeri NRRL 181]EAW20801.1 aromatic ring-opening dioxygenase, catalytic LigB subunit, putative [Aspergillus fischeri NRRL 181]